MRMTTTAACLLTLAATLPAADGSGKKKADDLDLPPPRIAAEGKAAGKAAANPAGEGAKPAGEGAKPASDADREVEIAARRLFMTAQDALQARDTERAVKILAALIEKYPTSKVRYDAWMALGRHHLASKEEAKAVDWFRKVQDLEKDGKAPEGEQLDLFLEAIYQTGVCWYNLKKFDAAFPMFRKITSGHPNTVWANQAYYYIGMAHFEQGNWAQAIEDLSLVGTFVDTAEGGSDTVEAGRRLYVRIQDSDLPIELRLAKRSAGVDRVEISTASGDRESASAVALAEKRGLYLASIATEMGVAKPGDGVLQVVGGDAVTVRYVDRSTKDGSADVGRSRTVKVASTASCAFARGTYEGKAAAAFIGQPAFLVVTDADEDRSDQADSVAVTVVSRFVDDSVPDTSTANPFDTASTQAGGKTWRIRDRLELKLTEAGQAIPGAAAAKPDGSPDQGAKLRSGRFQGSFTLVKEAKDASADHARGQLACAVGDEVVVTYVDRVHTQGAQPREATDTLPVLGELVVDPSTANSQHQDPVIATRVKLVESKSILEIARIFKSMGLIDGAKRKADEGLAKVDSVIRDTNQLPQELREDAFRMRWELQLAQDDLDAAFITCQLFSRHFPESAFADQALLSIGRIRLERGQAKDAIAAFAQVLKLANSLAKPEAQYLIASATEQQVIDAGKATLKAGGATESEVKAKALEAAIPQYKLCAERWPDSQYAGESLAKLVQYHIDTKDFAQANDLLEQVFVNHPDKPWLHRMLLNWTVLAYRMGDYQKAQDKCSQILLNYPSSPSAATARDLLPKIEAKIKASAPAGAPKTDAAPAAK